jgi:hypothetical protein
MPRTLAAIAGLWVGYIDGAGIGAGLIELLPGQETMEVSKVLLVSLLMTGPIGAFIGFIVAQLGGDDEVSCPRRAGNGPSQQTP